MGRLTYDFEMRISEVVKSNYTVCFPSGTAAITTYLMCMKVGKNSKVLMPNRTWIGTANSAKILVN